MRLVDGGVNKTFKLSDIKMKPKLIMLFVPVGIIPLVAATAATALRIHLKNLYLSRKTRAKAH